MTNRIYLNNGWGFTEQFTDELLKPDFAGSLKPARIPHTCKMLPFHYFSEHDYQMVCGYRRNLSIDPAWRGKRVLLTFEGAAHEATVYINGAEAGRHSCGYTAFTLDVTDLLDFEGSNYVTVRLDTRESLNVPPFGFVIDYLTYGGIYRDVYLEVKDTAYIKDVFVHSELPDDSGEPRELVHSGGKPILESSAKLISEIEVTDPAGLFVTQYIAKHDSDDFACLGTSRADAGAIICDMNKIERWDVESPKLYDLRTDLIRGDEVIDSVTTTFGFRQAEFKKDGFFLNGRRLRIRGLNRHQSYAYAGYAMPDSMQALDADICKKELGLNAVRTSHYPQSHAFISRCDELGLLVFTEFPGWQHIGDEAWKQQACVNAREMVLQYRNHPSIILWGIRINESVDDDEFYTRTNRIAHMLDPTRQTGGVRCYKRSNLLEDVYTYNDFSHTGKNAGTERKSRVTSDMNKPYMVTEYNGHMFPTKSYDSEAHRLEHALRHANVIDSVAHRRDTAGSFGWCMFDYNTHKDFGSGDRICHHGVMDMFRNPKLAASVYAMQQDETPVLEISASMDIGEHPASNMGDIYIFTNADSVRFYRNGEFISEFRAKDTEHKHLAHGPIRIDDFVGNSLEIYEKMPKKKASDIKDILNLVARKGMGDLSPVDMAHASRILLQYGMKIEDAAALYNKYVGNWGGNSTEYKFEAIKDGEVVKTVIKAPMWERSIELIPSSTELTEGKSYDVALVRIRLTDENGNLLNYANDPAVLRVEGSVELIGSDIISLNGGMGGTYVKTVGEPGKASLTVSVPDGPSATVEFEVYA